MKKHHNRAAKVGGRYAGYANGGKILRDAGSPEDGGAGGGEDGGDPGGGGGGEDPVDGSAELQGVLRSNRAPLK